MISSRVWFGQKCRECVFKKALLRTSQTFENFEPVSAELKLLLAAIKSGYRLLMFQAIKRL